MLTNKVYSWLSRSNYSLSNSIWANQPCFEIKSHLNIYFKIFSLHYAHDNKDLRISIAWWNEITIFSCIITICYNSVYFNLRYYLANVILRKISFKKKVISDLFWFFFFFRFQWGREREKILAVFVGIIIITTKESPATSAAT